MLLTTELDKLSGTDWQLFFAQERAKPYFAELDAFVTAAAAVWYLRRMKSAALSRSCFRLNPKIIGRTLSLGICSFLSQVSLVAAMAAEISML